MGSASRVYIKYEPEFDGGLAGWTINYIHKNFWRFAAHYEFEDLIQEAWIKFLYVKQKYPRVVEPEHFMSLYKTSLRNHFHDLALIHKDEKELVCLSVDADEEYGQILDNLPGDVTNGGVLRVLIEEAPREVKELLHALSNDAVRFRQSRKKNGACRETTNEFLCRVMGYNPKDINLRKMVIDSLSNMEGDELEEAPC